MAWTTPATWPGSTVMTAGSLNTHVRDNLDYLYDYKPAAEDWVNFGTAVTQVNQRIESGVVSVAFTTASSATAKIVFNTPFGTEPRVVASQGSYTGWIANAIAITTASAVAAIRNSTIGTLTGNIPFYWIATGA